jgi:outer membrane protein OmpA-like peptidoglycan-associated protein
MAGNRRVAKSFLIGAVLALWVLLLGTAVVWGLQNEQNDLRDRVHAALMSAEVPVQEIVIEGRDVSLAGAASEAERAEADAVLRKLEGVRSITWNDLPPIVIVPGDTTTPPETDAPGATSSPTSSSPTSTETPTTGDPTSSAEGQAHIFASLNQGVLRLSGAVPDPESAARVAAVADLIYAPFVEGSVEVDPSLEPAPWVANAAGVIAVLPVVSTSAVEVLGTEASITGKAPSDLRKAQLEGALTQALGPEVTVTTAIEVTDLEPPFFAARAPGDGTLVVGGVVPSQAVSDRIMGSAIAVYGADNVSGDLEVRSGVAETFSLYRVPVVFTLFAVVPQWEFAIDDDAITGALKGGATFSYGSSELSEQLIGLLNIAAAILTRNPTLTGTVAGHTDDVGSEGFNQTLSEARAQSAVDYLVAAGIDRDRLVAVGYGESRPIADNATAAGRAANRRIDFFLGPAPQGGA